MYASVTSVASVDNRDNNVLFPIAHATCTTHGSQNNDIYFPILKEGLWHPLCIKNGSFDLYAYGIFDWHGDVSQNLFSRLFQEVLVTEKLKEVELVPLGIFLRRVFKSFYCQIKNQGKKQVVPLNGRCEQDLVPASSTFSRASVIVALIAEGFLTIGSIENANFVLSRNGCDVREELLQPGVCILPANVNLMVPGTRTIKLTGNEDFLILASAGFWNVMREENSIALVMGIIAAVKRKTPILFEEANAQGHCLIANAVAAGLVDKAKSIRASDDITVTVILFPKILSILADTNTPLLFPVAQQDAGSCSIPDVLPEGAQFSSGQLPQVLPVEVADSQLHLSSLASNNDLAADPAYGLPRILPVEQEGFALRVSSDSQAANARPDYLCTNIVFASAPAWR